MTIKGTLTPVRDRVLVTDMHFGEQKTKSGIIIRDDDGTTRGIYPRWGKVYAKGHENNEDYNVGDWVLVEHGRWTRGMSVDDGSGPKDIRMVEPESILGWDKEKPNDFFIGTEYNTNSNEIRPEDFT